MKRAILNIADTGALESTAHMLERIGYVCMRPGNELLHELRQANLANVLSIDDLVKDWGYARPCGPMPAFREDMQSCDLFVDTKAHTNYPKIVARWPNLAGKVLWCCLNGGDPTKRTDGEPWADPPCPVLTNNQWYEGPRFYTCYPLYVRFDERKRSGIDGPPVCLVHNVERWGHGELVKPLQDEGVMFYGVNSPHCMLPHAQAMHELEQATCMVHLKCGDTVGYAVVEALAAKVPVLCTTRYIEETRLGALLEPGKTCLAFHDAPSFRTAMVRVRNAAENDRIGCWGRERLRDLMWRDADGFATFMGRNFK